MRPNAAEALKAAIRRSLPIVIILVVLGANTVNLVRQLQGARYSASARVYHTNTDLASALTDIQPAFEDPEREMETSLSLARAPEPYDRAARTIGGDGDDIRAVTTVTGDPDSDVLAFTARTRDPDRAVRIVNEVAAAYVEWRSDIQGAAIREAITQLEGQLRRSPNARSDLQDELERLRVLRTLNSGGAIVIERAKEAPKVSPAPVRDTLLGAAFGLIVALLIAGAREAFNTRIRSEADVEDALNRPVLASIQTLPRRAGLVTVGRHESRWGDTYALLAANVLRMRDKEGPQVLAVTSAIEGEGKTTTAANLAIAMALRGQRVVLADFDLRKPSLARFFRIPPDRPGIVQIIDGEVDLERALWAVELNGAKPSGVRALPASGSDNGAPDDETTGSLKVILSGGAERGARIARSPQVPKLLSRLAADADVVVLDTPPALATAEMAELSGSVDHVVVVVRHGRVTRRSLLALSRQSEGWRAEIVGAVLTDSPAEEGAYYYGKP